MSKFFENKLAQIDDETFELLEKYAEAADDMCADYCEQNPGEDYNEDDVSELGVLLMQQAAANEEAEMSKTAEEDEKNDIYTAGVVAGMVKFAEAVLDVRYNENDVAALVQELSEVIDEL